ncbi:hypothetical protein L3V82_01415 [Thiotrichales bacterium 19S3-7]|nr:hypothetical protein [Thiotrichales bacterium 19S3-7]MCF6800821.1 hypothetical protein [Thiotrichales bacterium 19S3-11]
MKFKLLSMSIVAGLSILSASCLYADDSMQIKISNDTNKTIYPLITANNQSCILSHKGIKQGQSYTFNLTRNCWNAGRVYLSDKPYQVQSDQPIQEDYQLAEYTFTNNKTSTVDYDFSAVDSLDSLPIAIEPIKKDGSTSIGFVGMNDKQSQKTIEKSINDFSSETGWPKFTNLPSKIPGGYNLFALTGESQLNQAKASTLRNTIINKWYNWYNDNKNYNMCTTAKDIAFCHSFENSVIDVINAFKANAHYNHINNPTQYQIIQHIMGYVPFNDPTKPPLTPPDWKYITTTIGDKVIGLLRGIPTKNGDHSKLFPDYDSIYNLNPYVTFIHKKLAMQIYAFSIDDSIGNLQFPNYNGIQIDVGGTESLPNQNPYTPPKPPIESKYHINLAPGWGTISGEICSTNIIKSNKLSFPISFSSKQCNVKLYSDKLNITFTLQKDIQGNLVLDESSYSGNIDYKTIYIGNKNINLPPPAH